MNRTLTAEQVRRYQEDGIVSGITGLGADEIRYYRECFEELEALVGGPQKFVASTHLYFPWAHELIRHAAIAGAAEDLLGPDVLVDNTVFLCKNPGDGAFAAWHQDGVYSGWYLTPSVSAWVALSDSTIENGCMRVVPGSHRSGRFEHRPFAGENSLFLRTEEVQVEVDEASARNVELRAGEFSLHDSNIIHGSKPNVSDTRRIGFVIRYVTPAFQRRRGNHPLVRVRGRADVAHVPLLETAPSGDAGESFARWRSA